jgi:hypothetical protein
LQAVQGVVMDERGHRPLAGEQMAEMFHLMFEVMAHFVGDRKGHINSHPQSTQITQNRNFYGLAASLGPP